MQEKKPVQRLLIRRRTAAEMLSSSISMLKRLERMGRLTPRRLGSRDVFYLAEQVQALVRDEGGHEQ